MTTSAGLERHIDAKANKSWVTFRAIVETARDPLCVTPAPQGMTLTPRVQAIRHHMILST